MNGRVRSFSDLRGYGFISGDDGQHYFVHHTMIEASGYRSLEPGVEVTFNPVYSAKGWQAHSVRVGGTDVATAQEVTTRELKANPFTPQDPVTDPHRFAGRAETLFNAIDCIYNNKNILVTGARGIGKSSVAYQLLNLTQGDDTLLKRLRIETGDYQFSHVSGDHRCVPGNTLEGVARGLLNSLFRNVGRQQTRRSRSFTEFKLDLKLLSASNSTEETTLPLDDLGFEFVSSTEAILEVVPDDTTGICFLIDEVDTLAVDVPLAPFLKAVVERFRSDGVLNVQFILSGVTGTTTDLISQHPSAGRLTETFPLEAMPHSELGDIVTKALSDTGVTIDPDACDMIIELSGQFPAPVHLLGYHAFRLDRDQNIDRADVGAARDFVVQTLKRQDFQGRIDRIDKELPIRILRVLALGKPGGVRLEEIAKGTGEEADRVAGNIGNLRQDGLVVRRGNAYAIAEPLFRIYLRWIFGSSAD